MERIVVVARVFRIDREDEPLAQVKASAKLAWSGRREGFGLALGGGIEGLPQAVLRSDGGVVPFRPVVGAEDLDQAGLVEVHLGDAEVAVLRRRGSLPVKRNAAAALRRLENPSAATGERAADHPSRPAGRALPSEFSSYGDSCAGASFSCASRSSCACASSLIPLDALETSMS